MQQVETSATKGPYGGQFHIHVYGDSIGEGGTFTYSSVTGVWSTKRDVGSYNIKWVGRQLRALAKESRHGQARIHAALRRADSDKG